MKKILIIIGFVTLVSSSYPSIDDYDPTDINCSYNTIEPICHKTTASNPSLNCCLMKTTYKNKDKKKVTETRCVGIKKDKEIIKQVKKETTKDYKDDLKKFKFKGIDCKAQIITVSCCFILLFALF